MTNEAVIVERNPFSNPIRFTVSGAVLIEKGTLMELDSTPKTALASTGADVFAGIAATEKVAADGSEDLALHVPGQGNIFDLKATGVITLGYLVSLSGANLIKEAVATDVEQGKIVGKALETAAHDEVIQVLV